jgi:predicted nucleic acid-binding protein
LETGEVYASVVVGGRFVNGTVRDVLATSEGTALWAPSNLREEAARKLPKSVERAKIPAETARAVLGDLHRCIEKLPARVDASSVGRARPLARAADATGDADYFAFALAPGVPIPTLDKDIQQVPGFPMLSTDRLESLPID